MSDARPATSTSAFGVGRRENHDATGFYSRFTPPVLSRDSTINFPVAVDEIFEGDARDIQETQVAPQSVALVVTSPPYFAGKEYEQDLSKGHVPSTYAEYLQMLESVFEACLDTLEPGGRMAVNVANLGRKPYRSLASDVIYILQDRLGMLLRGEIVWRKAKGAGGSTAWGSFQSPANPVLRDLTERVIVASKGRFDRALSRKARREQGLPSLPTITKDQFMASTVDVWEIPSESASRVGHPAPFPVDLPRRLIELYTYQGDLVLDPFMGSGSTAVAAVNARRHFIGFETDPEYVTLARSRIREAKPEIITSELLNTGDAVDAGEKFETIAAAALKDAGFTDVKGSKRVAPGLDVPLIATSAGGVVWHIEVAGMLTTERGGLRSGELAWRTLGRLSALGAHVEHLIVLTSELPVGTSADVFTAAVDWMGVTAVVDPLSDEGFKALEAIAAT